jgi:glutamine synthetase adenylyltransferase
MLTLSGHSLDHCLLDNFRCPVYLETCSMPVPESVENIITSLPDPDSARRFYADLAAAYPRTIQISEALLSDVLALSSYSPLLATTLLQNPEYIQWLGRERTDTKVRSKESLLESLSRFSLLHTDTAPNVTLARFRRRELLRIYLRDIRRLATVAEITEELSNLADATIEYALRLAKQDLENRFGPPHYADDRGRSNPADFCVVALGKLGSRELNYSSDIDLLFIYTQEGTTSGTGSGGAVTNREYFIKLAERIIQIAGGQSGEGAAYRIDMRLRPHGSIGRLALSLDETIRYYSDEARRWEQQVLIRSRAVAGDLEIYRAFHHSVEHFIFREDTNAADAVENVRASKRRLEDHVPPGAGYNVKLGRGGIREIEFIAQALQLAYGGRDAWLRAPHTLVSLSRISDRDLITDKQLTALFDAYEFLRRTEHLLQMEHGLQTHTIPKLDHLLLAKRAGFDTVDRFDTELLRHATNVQRVFASVFSEGPVEKDEAPAIAPIPDASKIKEQRRNDIEAIAAVSPHFAELYGAVNVPLTPPDKPFVEELTVAVTNESEFAGKLSSLRRAWTGCLLGIVLGEVRNELTTADAKRLQTELAEASINTALEVMRREVCLRFGVAGLPLDVLALGKLGGRGVDHGSDLDIVLVYPDVVDTGDISTSELYSRAVEVFVTTLSGMTRDGSLYRIDLRLRPYGKNGASSNPRAAFVEYFEKVADLWELLAFVKLRGVTGDPARDIEREIRDIIHRRAQLVSNEVLRAETLRIRQLLEREKGGRDRESDIKYGPGGMLDVYFAARYLQLRDNVPDRDDERSTIATLSMLYQKGSLTEAAFHALAGGYSFLSELDHNVRLTTGRARRIPRVPNVQRLIARRIHLADSTELAESLTYHRINIRKTFETILG